MESLLALDYVNPNQEIPNPSEARHAEVTTYQIRGTNESNQPCQENYIGKNIGEGTNTSLSANMTISSPIGWKIVDIEVQNYEPMLDLVLTNGKITKTIVVLFDWDITGTES